MSDCGCPSGADASCAERCDIFDFMARHVGMTVIHPGGVAATRRLAVRLGLSRESRVLDIACGRGTTALLLARGYACEVVGIDIAPDLIDDARRLAARKGLAGRASFQVADAQALPFEPGEFDATISQAMLVLVDDPVRSVSEAMRVTRAGGRSGWLELCWRREPPEGFIQEACDAICAYCMKQARTEKGWRDLFARAGVGSLRVDVRPMGGGGFVATAADEGLWHAVRMAWRCMANGAIRARMAAISSFMRKYADLFGYAVMDVEKPG